MAKKNFKSGLGDLIDEAMHASAKPQETEENTKKATKSFASGLDDFLQKAIEEGVQEQAERLKSGKKVTTKSKKPMFGIDGLIRETVETSQVEVMPEKTQRITFIFDEAKLQKLQKIAQLKKAYVKDVVNEIISEYIERNVEKLVK